MTPKELTKRWSRGPDLNRGPVDFSRYTVVLVLKAFSLTQGHYIARYSAPIVRKLFAKSAEDWMSNDTAAAEARGLYRMLAGGHTPEELRRCIGVPPKIERRLRFYAALNPVETRWIEKILKFRKSVAQEFERLVCCDGAEADRHETELDDFKESAAFAQPWPTANERHAPRGDSADGEDRGC